MPEAVFRYQFQHNASGQQTNAAAYFIAIDNKDPDDAFMFYGLAKGLLPTPGYRCQHILQDIQTLNERATRGELDVSAISIHAYAYVSDKYALLPSGASMGDGYGPILVAKTKLSKAEIGRSRIAVPGTLTSAFLTVVRAQVAAAGAAAALIDRAHALAAPLPVAAAPPTPPTTARCSPRPRRSASSSKPSTICSARWTAAANSARCSSNTSRRSSRIASRPR